MQNTHNVLRVRLRVVEDDKQSRLKEKSYATRRQNANVHWGFSSSWLRTYLHPSTTTSQKEVVCFAHIMVRGHDVDAVSLDEEQLLLQLAVLDGRARKLTSETLSGLTFPSEKSFSRSGKRTQMRRKDVEVRV